MSRETAYVNATIHTVDARSSVAEALLIRDERIIAVGSNQQVLAAAGAGCVVKDASGKTLVPGFIDPHNHLSQTLLEGEAIDCSAERFPALDDVLQAIQDASVGLVPGEWMRGYGFTPLALAEGRGPTREELDEAAPHNPLLLMDVSCHRGWVNSAALTEIGVDEYTPQPWGGVIVVDHRGRPTGELLEAAINLFQSSSWRSLMTRDRQHAIDLLDKRMRAYAGHGITAVCDAAVTPDVAAFYAEADRAGALLFPVQQMHTGDHFFSQQDPRRPDFVSRVHERESARLRGGTMKLFVDPGFPDGPMISCTRDGKHTHRGSTFYGHAEVAEIARGANELGIRTAIHAMGNWAVDAVLDAYESVRRGASDDGGLLRLEHAFVSTPDTQAPRMAELGVDLVAFPGIVNHTGPFFDEEWRGEFRDELTVIAVRSMIDAGVRVSFASDAPAGPFSPAESIWNAVTRASFTGVPIDPEEAISAAEALRCVTINAAHAAGRGDDLGSLEVGKRASIVVLDRDILSCSPDDIQSVVVVATMVDGRAVYETVPLPDWCRPSESRG